ncbi:MAG: hypothetical protein ACI31M_01190 [Bacilli bacterium]
MKYLLIFGYAFLMAYFINRLCFKFKDKRNCIKYKCLALIISFTLLFSFLCFSNKYYLGGIILLIMSLIAFYILIIHTDIKKLLNEYKNVVNYVNTNEDLIQKYRFLIHENRNQLIYIRNMTDKKNKELISYIDNLLNNQNKATNDDWIENSLINIKLNGLRGFLEFKLSEMKKENLKLEISISDDVKDFSLKTMDISDKEKLYTIIGVLIDNAKEALIEKKKKNFSFNIYVRDNKLYIIFANEICTSFDSTFIYKKKYSTKGLEHGNGLGIVKKIANHSKLFNLFTDVYDNYFVQTLVIGPKTTKN